MPGIESPHPEPRADGASGASSPIRLPPSRHAAITIPALESKIPGTLHAAAEALFARPGVVGTGKVAGNVTGGCQRRHGGGVPARAVAVWPRCGCAGWQTLG